MAIDPRDAIWNETHNLLYNVSYTEALETALLGRWTWLDSVTKIAVATSSGGAALTGLVFWKNSDYTFLWPLFTSISALLAIVSKELSVAKRIKVHAASVSSLSVLRTDIQSLIFRMKVNAEFSIADFEEKLLTLRDRYKVESDEFPYDLLLTERLRQDTQKRLNANWLSR